MSKLSHIDDSGKAHMVDVADKVDTHRIARAEGHISMSMETLETVRSNSLEKGDVLAIARIAGIMAAKKTSDLIPLCHPLALSKVAIDFEFLENGIRVESTAKLKGKTGVEMEALTACSVALLTVYDMAKAIQKDMVISNVRLLFKSGGKSGDWAAS